MLRSRAGRCRGSDDGKGKTQMGDPRQTVDRLRRAIEGHDLEEMVDCFHPDVVSEQPAHPDRDFRGRDQIRTNWAQIFGGVPDLRATLVRCAVEGLRAWAEWSWDGTRRDGEPFELRGITILEVAEGRITSLRFYMEPLERAGAGIDAAIHERVAGT